jgi:Mce-associated membrane protein
MTETADQTTASGLGWPDAAVPGLEAAGSPEPQGIPGGRRWQLAAALLLVAAIAATALAGLQHRRAADQDRRQEDEQAAVAAARKIALALDTYDYKDLDASFQAVLGAATDPFKSQYASTTTQLKELLVRYQATATGAITAAGVAGHTGDSVTVLLFVDQTVTNTNAAQPRLERNRLQLVMRKVKGRFLVAEAQLL